MSIFAIINLAFYPLLALGAALAVVAALGLLMHGERLWSSRFVPAIAPLIALGIAVSSLLSGRNLALAEKHIDMMSEQPGGGASILRLITLIIVSIALAKLIGTFVRRQSVPVAPGTPLFVALMVYIVASNFLPSAFGTVPTFVHSLFYPALIFSAAWAARRESPEATLSAAKAALYTLMIGSLIAALIVPAIAVQPDYQGLIPGLNIRLWGLGSNPNSIGPLALLTLMMEYLHPTRKRWLRALLIAATGLVFMLAQSKTVWIALLIVATILAWHRWVRGRSQEASIVVVLVLLGAGIAFLTTLLLTDVGAVWDRFLDSKEGANVTSFSGRTGIWEVALQEWERSPLFGYGPEIWGLKFRIKIGMPFAFSAHNQFLQTLSVAGTLGFVALLAYLRYVIPAALRAAAATRGVSLALLSMISFRCISEAPLAMTGLIDGDALTHFLFFVIILRAPTFEQVRYASRPTLAGLRS